LVNRSTLQAVTMVKVRGFSMSIMMKGIPITHAIISFIISKMDDTKELEDLNYEKSKQHMGGVVFVSILMIFGIIGNLHVLFVYMFRMKPSNPRTCILTLALLDMIACVIGMPFIIMDMLKPLTFTMVTACCLDFS
jgi:hypothetical protein